MISPELRSQWILNRLQRVLMASSHQPKQRSKPDSLVVIVFLVTGIKIEFALYICFHVRAEFDELSSRQFAPTDSAAVTVSRTASSSPNTVTTKYTVHPPFWL